ncbi:uncharacterized protein CCOS01_00411 [Colletotrichum costaricense]|uniref:Uncharacterized protein n=1 Tax=Colletotrichum costaricense TaxID=1209916 RepID=A0AAI9Z974_9PEZI|nr:uncharacterized protein CCOS01_00411 [Colletotrichum costaricense]KAK1539097.1 hypothetical protein CCOS01_00411 [Colletotrichum costaricense]
MGPTTTNPTATITNNSGYGVDIYDVFNPSSDPSTPVPLTYTLLATVPNGAVAQPVQTIHFASQVQAMLSGTIKELNGNYYQQFPVAVLAVSPFADSNAITITSDMLQSMVDSFKFIKYVQANPSSQLSTKFNTALADKSQEDAVDQLFKGTGSFQLCTLITWTAVFTWQAQFTSAWQGTYYLYSGGDNSAGSTSDSSAPALQGTLAITASADASSAVLTMAGTGNVNTPVVMAGNGTMQEENQGNGNLSVALTPAWLNLTSTNDTSSYAIAASFVGKINDIEVAGSTNQLSIPSSSDDSNSSQTWPLIKHIIDSVESLTTSLVNIGLLYYMVKDFKQDAMQKKNDAQQGATSKSDAKDRESKAEADSRASEVSQVNKKSESNKATIQLAQQQSRDVAQSRAIQIDFNAIKGQEQKLAEALETGPSSDAVVEVAEDLEAAGNNLGKAVSENATEEARNEALTDASASLKNTSAKIDQELKGEGSQLSQEQEGALKSSEVALDKADAQSNAVEKLQKEEEDRAKDDVKNKVEESPFDDSDTKAKGTGEGGESHDIKI